MKTTTSTLNIALFFLLSILLSACGGGGGGGSKPATDDANTITELKVSSTTNAILLGAELTLYAQAIYDDGSSADVTESAIWKSSDANIATFESARPNVIIGKKNGSVVVTASFDGVDGTKTVTVSSPTLETLTLSNDTFDLGLGETSRIEAKGTYSDGTITDVTNDVDWKSDNEGIATVGNEDTNAGLIEVKNIGSTKITASLDEILATATVNVNDVAISSVAIVIESTDIPEGAFTKLKATATYINGGSGDVTGQATWQSDDPLVASVSDETASKGFLSALSAGTTRISAQVGEFPAETSLTVVVAPNKPGSLTLQANPNVILNDASDTAVITATVLPNDRTNGVLVDGTTVSFIQDGSNLALTAIEGATVSGKVKTSAVSSIPGDYKLMAEVPGTIAIDAVELEVVSSFSKVISTSETVFVTITQEGFIGAGGKIIGTITNTSNRAFDVKKATLLNRSGEVATINDPSQLNGGTLIANGIVNAPFILSEKFKNEGIRIHFELQDNATGTTFNVDKKFVIN